MWVEWNITGASFRFGHSAAISHSDGEMLDGQRKDGRGAVKKRIFIYAVRISLWICSVLAIRVNI